MVSGREVKRLVVRSTRQVLEIEAMLNLRKSRPTARRKSAQVECQTIAQQLEPEQIVCGVLSLGAALEGFAILGDQMKLRTIEGIM